MSESKRVVVADADRERAESMARGMAACAGETVIATSGQEILFACRKGGVDALVAADGIEDPGLFAVVAELRSLPDTHGLPIVLLLESGDSRGAHRARLVGADRVLHRPLEAPAVENELRALLEMRASGAAATIGLERLAEALSGDAPTSNPLLQHITDPWTGLFNWPYTEIKLAEEVKRAKRFRTPLTCVLLGIDQVEAFEGRPHEAALKSAVNELSGLLLCESRDIDHLSRYGLGELCALLFSTDGSGARIMTERILESVRQRRIRLPGSAGELSASAGIACLDLDDEEEDAERLLRRAEAALRQSRQWGGNRCTLPDGEC